MKSYFNWKPIAYIVGIFIGFKLGKMLLTKLLSKPQIFEEPEKPVKIGFASNEEIEAEAERRLQQRLKELETSEHEEGTENAE